MDLTRHAVFLLFVKVLVNETTRDEPMTREQIIGRCREDGIVISRSAFFLHLEDLRQAGIVIGKKPVDGKQRGTMLYWYDEGWI